MFETHKQNHAFANSPRCNLTPLEWMCLSVTSVSDRSEGKKKKQQTTGAFNFQLSGIMCDATVQSVSSPNSARCCRKNETGTGLLIETVTLSSFH